MTIDLDTSECFFHYTTREAAFEHILPTGKLRFSTYEQMRDPMENRWRWGGAWFISPEEDPRVREKLFFEFLRGSQGIFRQAHLLALTVDAEDYAPNAEWFKRGWSRARMWEHYAEKHAGVCLVFDKKRLIANVGNDLGSRNPPFPPYHAPVEYSETGPDLELSLGEFPPTIDGPFIAAYIEEHRDQLFFQKVQDWQTEYEYRFVTLADPEQPLYVDYGDALVGIVAGEQIPDWQRPGAIATGREVGIEPVIMNWEMGRPLPVPLTTRTRKEREQVQANFELRSPADPPPGA